MDLKDFFKPIMSSKGRPILGGQDYWVPLLEGDTRVGLDIGSSAIKMVRSRSGPKGAVLANVACKEFLSSEPTSAKQNDDDVIQAVTDLWQEQGLKDKKVRLIISDPSVYLRHITVPRVAEEEVSKAIRWQAEKYTPFSIDDACVDYQTVDSQGKGTNQMEIIIVAVPKQTIDRYLSILKAAKLTPTVIDVTPFATAKAVISHYPLAADEIVPVIDIGMRTTSIVIVKAKSLLLVRNIDLAGTHFTKAIADGMKVDRREAEKMKKENRGEIFTLIEPVLKELAGEIERSFAYCEREFAGEKMQKVILSGGGARLAGMDQYLHQVLGLSVELADPLSKSTLGKTVGDAVSPDLSCRLTAALGEVS